jgi:hypothetical protein
MRLSIEEVRDLKEALVCDKNRKSLTYTCCLELIDTIESMQQDIEQLLAQVARMREACIKGFSFLSLLFHRADIRNWDDIGMCSVKDVKHAMDELENAYKSIDTVQDYHNPADVEALRKAREALIDAEPYTQYSAEARVHEAIAEIDKAIGGNQT